MPARAARAAFLGGVMRPVLRSTLTVETFGAEVFDTVRDTPVIIVSNHSSHLDAPMLLCALPPRVRSRTAVTAAADYFFGSLWRGAGSALAFSTVPVDRSGGVPSTTPLTLLQERWNLVIFPEGTRSRDGARGRFRLGAAYLAINAGVPVVPVGFRGAFAAMPRGRNWPVPGRPRVTVRFGAALRPQPGERVREFSARLAAEVDRLCAEDVTTWWDATRDVTAQSPTASPTPQATRTPIPGQPLTTPALPTPPVPASADAPPTGSASATAMGGTATAGTGTSGTGTAGGSVSVSARLRGAPGTPSAQWRRIWEATEPVPRASSRSPWRR